MVGEPSPALPVLSRQSSARPALSRLSRASSGSAARQVDHTLALRSTNAEQRLSKSTTKDSRRAQPKTVIKLQRLSGEKPTTLLKTPKNSPSNRPFCYAGPRPCAPPIPPASFSAPPPFELHPEASRRGRALSLSLHPAPFGGRGSQFWLGAREIIPPKRGPSFT